MVADANERVEPGLASPIFPLLWVCPNDKVCVAAGAIAQLPSNTCPLTNVRPLEVPSEVKLVSSRPVLSLAEGPCYWLPSTLDKSFRMYTEDGTFTLALTNIAGPNRLWLLPPVGWNRMYTTCICAGEL